MASTTIFDTKDSVFFVGGRGTKAGDADAGGGCTAELWGDLKSPSKNLSDIMGTNGEPLSDASAWNGSQTACTVTNHGSGKARITKNGAFSNCIVGMIANVVTSGVIPAANDRYEIIAVDGSGNYVDCNFEVTIPGTCDIKAGGAFDKIQTASDETTADGYDDKYNVDILTNKAETFSGTGDKIILNFGGGDTDKGTKKRIIGVNDSGVRLTSGSYVTIDAGGYDCHVFEISGTIYGIELHHIAAINNSGSNAGFKLNATGAGFVLNECKSTGCYQGINSATSNTRGVSIIGGYYSSDTNSPIYFYQTYGVVIKGVVVNCTVNQPCIYSGAWALTSINGCLIKGNGNIACIGIKQAESGTVCEADYNVMYNVGHGFDLANNNTALGGLNNVIVVAEKANGKAIKFTDGSVLYFDYSCLWALDGAPAASERWGGTGLPDNSIEADPQFEDAANGDFRLKMSSPCLRTGRPTLGQL